MRNSIVAGLLLALSACSASSSGPEVGAAAVVKSGVANQVTMLGRYKMNDDGTVSIGWPGAGFALETASPVSFEINDSGGNKLDVSIDGERSIITTQPGTHTYEIAPTSLSEIVVRRRSESFATGMTIKAINTASDAKPTVKRARRILFVGDSIIAGYGVLGADRTCTANADNSSAQDAYAALTAQNFGADYHLVAVSGRGAAVNWGADPRPNILSQLHFALPDLPSDWDHTLWSPDIIVVALGTNDWSQVNPDPAFTANMTGLFMGLAGMHPDATILAITGPMLAEEKAVMANASIAQATKNVAAYGIGVDIIDLTLSKEEAGKWGCQWHPGQTSSRAMATTLSQAISKRLGWAFTE